AQVLDLNALFLHDPGAEVDQPLCVAALRAFLQRAVDEQCTQVVVAHAPQCGPSAEALQGTPDLFAPAEWWRRWSNRCAGAVRRHAPSATTAAAVPYAHAWRGKPGSSRPAR